MNLRISFSKGLMAAVVALSALTATTESAVGANPYTAYDVFSAIPESELPMLPYRQRLDMVDYFRANSDKQIYNIFSGEATMQVLTDDYIKVATGLSADLQIKVLPAGKKCFAVECYTVGDAYTARDSKLKFLDITDGGYKLYTKKGVFTAPELEDFISVPKDADITLREVLALISYPTIEYSLSTESTDLVARLTVEQFMNIEDYNTVKDYILPEIRYQWSDKGRYIKK